MSESLVWTKSGVRPNRFFARVDGKRVVVKLARSGREWLLMEDGKKVAGARVHERSIGILQEMADQHYTHGKRWAEALVLAEAKIPQ